MSIGTDAAIADAAGNIVIKLPHWHMPWSPLLWRVGQGEERDDRCFDRSRDMHGPGIVCDGEVSRLDERTEIWEGQCSCKRKDSLTALRSYFAQYALNQFPLILSSRQDDFRTKLLNQQVDDLSVHFPWIGTCWHARAGMNH